MPSFFTSRRLAASLLVLSAAALTAPSAQGAEMLKLDLHDEFNQFYDSSSVESQPLAAGESYVVTVTGTGSTWGGKRYPQGTCGIPEERPMEESPDAQPTVAGWDAQTVFGAPLYAKIGPLGKACGGITLPFNYGPRSFSGFQMSQSAGVWERPDPVGGPRTVPRTDHSYSYEIVGTGVPLRFRFADNPVNDNSGVLTIDVRSSAECAAISCLAKALPQFDQLGEPAVAASRSTLPLSGVRECQAARVLSVRLLQPRGSTFAKTTYYLNDQRKRTVSGKAIPIKKGSRQVRAQKFRNLPAGAALRLRVEVTTTRGHRLSVRRAVPRCQTTKKARLITFR